MSALFLTAEEVAELTGIRGGKKACPREFRQIQALRKMKIPHYVNAAGRPVVARAVIVGIAAVSPPEVIEWEPAPFRPRLAHG